MRIGINARFLVAKRTGVQRAAYNLLRSLVGIDRDNEYFLFTGENEKTNPEWNFPNVHVVGAEIREGESIRNHLWEQFQLPRLAKKYQVDILHSPANMAPIFYKGKSIVHIHDLCFVVNPQWYSFPFHTIYNLVIPRLAHRASKVITNSNNSRNDLLQFCDVSSDRVSLIYWAVDEIFSEASDNLKATSTENPAEGYILYVGSLEPRKNIRTLIESFEHMRNQNPKLTTKLVLIGGESPLFAEVRLNVKRYKNDVIFKGFVNDELLRDYYRRATLVVYPSLYEGFGLPPLEAMASGTPVVTSNTSSIPEVVGDAALMVSPMDVEGLSDAMLRVLNDPELRAVLRRKGLEQVKKFNWMRVAKHTLAVYYEVHHSKRNDAEAHYMPLDVWRKLSQMEKDKMQLLTNI